MSDSDDEIVLKKRSAAEKQNAVVSGTRSRRPTRTNQDKNAALDMLRRGKRKTYQEDVKPVYEVVDEEKYSDMVRQRQEEDWIVDDGTGYVDDGRDVLDDDAEQADGGHNGQPKAKRHRDAAGASGEGAESKGKKKGIKNFFATCAKPKDERSVTVQNDDVLNDILNDVHAAALLPTPNLNLRPVQKLEQENEFPLDEQDRSRLNPFSRDRAAPTPQNAEPKIVKPAPVKATASARRQEMQRQAPSVAPAKVDDKVPLTVEDFCDDFDADSADSAICEDDYDRSTPVSPCQPTSVENTTADSDVGTAFIESKSAEKSPAAAENFEKGHRQVAKTSPKPEPQSPDVATTFSQDTFTQFSNDTSIVKVENATSVDRNILPLVEGKDGQDAMLFYWIDAYEDAMKQPGTIYMFGRVQDKTDATSNSHSCCVVVRNVERVVYFLPREERKSDGSAVEFTDIHQEVQELLMRRFRIDTFRVKKSSRMNVFDVELPKEADYLEVHYPARFGPLPSDLTGDTFSLVTGTSASPLELFLLHRELRGPAWVIVDQPVASSPPITWCSYECSVDSATHVTMADKASAPADSPEKIDYISVVANERALLSLLLAKIHKLDPDVIVGHDLFGRIMDLLVSRLAAVKVPNWSRLSRLRRAANAPKIAHSGHARWARLEATAGRLLCDSRAAATELVHARSYDLSELSSQILNEQRGEEWQPSMVVQAYKTSIDLARCVQSCMADALLSLKIVGELNALPLFSHITQVVGGVLSRTLTGGRAERNEYLLMHAFRKRNILCPDKRVHGANARKNAAKGNKPSTAATQQSQNNPDMKDGDSQEMDEAPQGVRRKAAYAGGLVLEPKKGLYDTYILLLDFNSLYPSIIQEFNICFTTVDQRTANDDGVPDVPSSSSGSGVLPAEIKRLVESRREVKKMMKQPGLSQEKLMQLNVRQLALKLTANSMYGCLGFPGCRFYAQPLAALVTSKGRTILQETKSLAENRGLSVIYGDTDSIMIDSACRDFKRAMEISKEVKREVNGRYKLLELDLDGVYNPLLLLKKKKYAGVLIEIQADGKTRRKREMKGLDIVRRDWCLLAKEAGNRVLDFILCENVGLDEALNSVHEYLEQLAEKVRAGQIDEKQYEICKALTRPPNDYAERDKKQQPHVLVALRLNQTGSHFKSGDTIPYVVCKDGTDAVATQRAYHPRERQSDEKLVVDIDYYLAQQVHPVVTRLLEPVSGTDACRIAQCLGLDAAQYKSRVHAAHANSAHEDDNSDEQFGSILDFSQCKPFAFRCYNPQCSVEHTITAPIVTDSDGGVKYSLGRCGGCGARLYNLAPVLCNALDATIRKFVDAYFNSPLRCTAVECGYSTRKAIGRYNGGKPICPKCSQHVMLRPIGEKALYAQIAFFEQIFDVDKAKKALNDEQRRKLALCTEQEEIGRANAQLRKTAATWLRRSAYCEVDLGEVFQKLMTTKRL